MLVTLILCYVKYGYVSIMLNIMLNMDMLMTLILC